MGRAERRIAGTAHAPADGAGRAPTPAPERVAPPPPELPPEPWATIVGGLREAVLVCDRDGVVRTANERARELVPGLVVGEVVDVAGWAPLTRAVHAAADHVEGDVAARRVVGRRRDVPDGSCWYLLDVTDERRRADSLLAAQSRAHFLAEAGRAMHGVLHLDRTMRTIVAHAAPRLAPVALLLVADGSDGVRWARHDGAARPAAGELSLADLRHAPRLVGALTASAAASEAVSDPWLAVELADLDLWNTDGADQAGRATVVVPVPSAGLARAVLVLAGERPASGDDGLVEEYASRAGAALSAAALYREQSHLGAVLQESLAPPALPECPGVDLGATYRPARESLRVGGDFYEVVASPGETGETAFLLGDVCGKGVEAAVLSGRVRQSLHALRLVERRPVAVLELLNTALLEAAASYGEPPRFATLVLGGARRRDSSGDGSLALRLATGGHPPPLVLRADGTVEEVAVRGTLVGALREARFAEAEIVLAPGETCLLYSDGVTEARRGPDDFFGEERLAAAFASCVGATAQVVCERVAQLLSEWLDGRDHDDVALLAVRAPALRGER